MKALIVDDEKPVRNCIRLLGEWEKCGFDEVHEAESYDEALEYMEKYTPNLVITDIRMPGHDGLELMDWLHEHCPETVVIVISAYNDFNYAVAALRSGALDYLLKPIQPDSLNKLLEKAGDVLTLADRKQEDTRYRLDKNEKVMMSLSDIAAMFYRSPEHIARVFKEEYGESVVNYIARVRIERAQKMLKTTTYRIADIAHRVGYEDEKYFCRVFRKVVGMSPAEYRKV